MNIFKSFLEYISQLYRSIKNALNGRYRWLIILLTVWLFRIEFMSGAGQTLQVSSFALACYIAFNMRNGLLHAMSFQTNSAVRAMVLFYTYAIISSIWSIWPSYSFALSVQDFMVIGFGVLVLKREYTFEQLEKIFLVFSVFMIIFLFVCSRLTQTSLWVHHLTSGTVSAIIFAYCFAEYLGCDKSENKRIDFLKNTMVLALVSLILSTSTGAYVAVLAGIAIAFLFSRKRIYVVVAVLVGVFLTIYEDMADKIMQIVFTGKDETAIETVSGREVLWDMIREYAMQRPWFGWGFGGVERAITFEGEMAAMDAHNSYLGIWGGLGFVGCGLGLLFVWRLVRVIVKHLSVRGFAGLAAALVTAFVNAYTFGFLSGKTCSISIMFFVLVILTDVYADAYKRQQENEYQL